MGSLFFNEDFVKGSDVKKGKQCVIISIGVLTAINKSS